MNVTEEKGPIEAMRVEELTKKLTILNIGAGGRAERIQGWTNCDLYPGKNIDVVFDATRGWPFDDNSVSTIIATHVLEHLNDFRAFFSEAWRVLDPVHGRLFLALPHAACDAGIGDPTHVQQWNAIRFCFLQPGYDDTSHNPQHASWKHPFKVELVMERVNGRLGWLCRWPIWQWFGLHAVGYLWNAIAEMKVQLKPLKSDADVKDFLAHNQGNCVPTAYFIYEHEIARRNLKPGEPMKVRWLTWYLRGFTDQGYRFGDEQLRPKESLNGN